MPSFPGWGPDNPFFKGFEEDPEGQLGNFLARFSGGLNRGQLETAQGLFQPYRSRYKQEVGQQLLGGAKEAGSWSDFLRRFDLDRLLRRESEQQDRSLTSPAIFRY